MELDLFDCDVAVGRRHGASELELFSPADLLASMDRCGIRRALVAHHSCWQSEINLGNQLLMEVTAGAPRLSGCWTMVPDEVGDTPPIAQVLEQMLASGARAVRCMPKTMKWNLAEWCAGRLFKALEERRIPALIPYEETSYEVLHEVLTKHPKLRVVLLQMNYRTDRELYPFAMAHPNLFLSMAPRHSSHDGIERLRDKIGAERLCFGTRWPEAEPGGAVAFVAYARIADAEKKLIAGGNLDRLLAGGDRVTMDALAQAALAGRPLDVPVIDAHGHIGSWFEFPSPRSTCEGLIAAMDGIGVDRLAISGIAAACGMNPVEGNDMVLEAVAKHPDRFIGYAVVSPPDGEAALAEFQRCEARGLRALKLHTWHGRPYTDAAYRKTLEYVNAKKYPILVHTWGAGDMKMLAEVAAAYPDSIWILAHTPSDWAGYLNLVERFPNVYLELCCSACPFGVVEHLVAKAGPDRILYGSDCGFIAMAMQVGRVAFANVAVEAKKKILGGNAARVFEASMG